MWPTFHIPPCPTGDPLPPGYYNNGCGTEAPFRPTNIPNLRIGDFMLWVCVTNVGRTWVKSAALMPPTGWNIYSGDVGRRNWNNSGVVIFYRWATSDDLNPATLYVASFQDNPISTGNPYRVCSVTYAYRDVHPNMPFGSRNTSRAGGASDWSRIESLFMHIGHDQAPCVMVAGSRVNTLASAEWGLQSANPLGPELSDEVRFSLPYEVDSGCNAFYVGRRIGAITEGENWIAGETATASLQDSGWASSGIGLKAMYNNHARLKPDSLVSGRHYVEYTVSLTAGQVYSFHFSRRGPWKTGYSGAVGISYVDPSSNERGVIAYNSDDIGGMLNPLSDYGSVWTVRAVAEIEDGTPSTAGSTPVLTFTAQATGNHKLRISVTRAIWNGSGYDYYWSFLGTSSEYRDVRGVCFRRGNVPAYFLPTSAGAVMAGEALNGALGSCWDAFEFGDPSVTCPGGTANHLALSLNYNQPLVPAVMENFWNHGDTVGLVNQNTIYGTYVTSDDAAASASSSRPVMPRIDGVLKKYYFEVTLLSTKNIHVGVALGSCGGGAAYFYNTRNGRVYIPNADESSYLVGTPVAPAIGDVWGVLVNYVDKEITWSLNGTAVATVDMLDTYGTSDATNSGKTGWDWPLYAYVANYVRPWPTQVAGATVNLAGPFEYQPAGTLEFDWASG